MVTMFILFPWREGRCELTGDWQHVVKTREEQKCSSEDFLQEVQGRRVDEALFGDLCEFGLDEWSAGKKKEVGETWERSIKAQSAFCNQHS